MTEQTSAGFPKITGIVKNARIADGRLHGQCYHDTEGRFFQGEYITTSAIQRISNDLVITKNSAYYVASWAPWPIK